MTMATQLRDLIYFDVGKTSSLLSQLERGLVTEVQDERAEERDERNIRTYDFKLFQPEFGGVATEKRAQIATKIFHHDLLDRVERALFSGGYALDLNAAMIEQDASAAIIRETLAEYSCVRVTGLASIEDYQRLTHIAERLNPVLEFIERCGRSTLESSEEYQALRQMVEEQKAVAQREKDRNKRAAAMKQVKESERKLEGLLAEALKLDRIEPWLVDGIQLFVDTFLKNRVVMRLYPFHEVPEFGVLANLKRDSFVDTDIENVLFAYGPRPNLQISVLGIVTSMPSIGEHPLERIRIAQKLQSQKSEEEAFEEGFRGAFEGIEELERFVRYSRYPNVTLYPLAVYRTLPAGIPRY